MARIKCRACSGWMFDQAVICPHCGANQQAGDPLLEGLDEPPAPPPPKPEPKPQKPISVSREEARALSAWSADQAAKPEYTDSRPGMVSWLFLPHTLGRRRSWEIAMCVVAAPLMALTVFVVGWWAVRYRLASTAGLARVAVPTSAAALFCLAMAWGAETWQAIAIPGTMLLAWLIREIIRSTVHDPYV